MKKTKPIPVKSLAKEFDHGIAIENFTFDALRLPEGTEHSHRHDYHLFAFQEKGKSYFEIDFKKYQIRGPSVVYIAPNQVHKALKAGKIKLYLLAINHEHLHPDYLKLLHEISPTKPLPLNTKTLSIISQATSLCINLFERKENKLYLPILKDSCNTLVALIIAQYLKKAKPGNKLSRFDITTKAFRLTLEKRFATDKRPADYARKLNISVAYLNECVKNVTGYSVSHHIQQRVVLEAKRLLYHSNKSVKEIATALGFDDNAYFSRWFSKLTGMSASAFRNKNRD